MDNIGGDLILFENVIVMLRRKFFFFMYNLYLWVGGIVIFVIDILFSLIKVL